MRTIHRMFAILLATSLLIPVTARLVSAQALATMTVTVEDKTGGVIAGANVTLTNKATGAQRTSLTNESGVAVLLSIPPGNYDLKVNAKDFAERSLDVKIEVGQASSLRVTLGIELKQSTEVHATAQAIDKQKAELSQVIEEGRVADLPIQGRQFIDFALLTPTVVIGRSTSVGSQAPFTETTLKLSFSGVRETHTVLITLDGLDYTTSISGVQRASPSQDWVQEFRVVSDSYTVDTGRHLGGVVNTVTKSGSNDFHGSAYEFFRNDALNVDNLLSTPRFDTLRFNQFGVALGGPIIRSRSFFFGGYEGQRRAESPIYSDFILQNINGINAIKQSFGLSPEDLSSVLRINDYDQFITKVDHWFNSSNSLSVRYLFSDQRNKGALGAPPGLGTPSTFRDNPIRDQTVSATALHIFSPSLTSELGFQFGQRSFHLDPVGIGLEPSLQIPNLLQTGGLVGSVTFYRERRLQFAENLLYQRGNHSFKFGGEFHEVWDRDRAPGFTPGLAIFSPESFFGAPPFPGPTALLFLFGESRSLFGQQLPARDPNFQAGLFASPAGKEFEKASSADYRHEIYAVYGQDQWRIRPSLMFTFGVRFEAETKPSELTQGRFFKNDLDNVEPRVGFAYSFRKDRDVLRGGFGIFHGQFGISDLIEGNNATGPIGPFLNNPLVPQFANPQRDLIGLATFGPVGAIPGPFTAGSAFANFVRTGAYPDPSQLISFPLGFSQRDFPTPYAEQASLQLEHQVGREIFVTAGYSFVHALKLHQFESVNARPVGLLPNGKTQFAPADFRFGFTLLNTPTGYSIYHAGILGFRKIMSHHYTIVANYVWSRSIDNITTIQLSAGPEDFLKPQRERAVSDNHIAHRFTASVLAEAPDRIPLLRGFKLSALTTAESARYFNIFAGFDVNGDGFPFTDRVGLTGRNVYRGARLFDVDLRVQREFRIVEPLRGIFSAEIFNLTDRDNVLDVNNVYGAPDFIGPQPRHFGDGIRGPVPSFGTPKSVAPARQIQFSFRLKF